MALAHEVGEDKCTIYSQDISQRSNKMLKLNLILNNLVSSLDHAIQGDTLTDPYHKSDDKKSLRQFDYVVSNPPFRMNFSDTREKIAEQKSRFWAGVPSVPKKDVDKMAIYTCFIQHVINSLKPNGKGAIVVPTGFIDSSNGVAKKILHKIIDDKIVYGCISMPSNVFANTGTNVSVLFFDNARCHEQVVLINASKLGEEYKDSNGLKKRRLRENEINQIIDSFLNKKAIDDFSVVITYDELKEKYSLSAGQYFNVKIEYIDISQEEYDKIIDDFNTDFAKYVEETNQFQKEIREVLKELKIK